MREGSSMRILFTTAILVGSLALWGCPKRPEVTQAPPAPVGPGAAAAPTPAPAPPSPQTSEAPVVRPSAPAETPVQPAPPAAAVPAASPLKDIFFDFDKSNVKDDQKAALNEDVAWLKASSGAKLTIEGHCDERGTVEYNLGLGERRAKAGKDYLVAAGIAADRIAIISYGKERPFVLGHDEAAWKWNRRDHMVIGGQ
jgi:peptidoglycan-associated lipoprotein